MTPEDQRQTLERIREHLVDDERLVFNVFDPRLDIIAAHSGSRGAALKKGYEFAHPVTGRRVVDKTYSQLNLRYVYRYEMQHLLERSGFRVEALCGDFEREPFRYGGEQVWVARRD